MPGKNELVGTAVVDSYPLVTGAEAPACCLDSSPEALSKDEALSKGGIFLKDEAFPKDEVFPKGWGVSKG